jgi:hypothetical protein
MAYPAWQILCSSARSASKQFEHGDASRISIEEIFLWLKLRRNGADF